MISYYFISLASEAEPIAHLEKPKLHDEAGSISLYFSLREPCNQRSPAVDAARCTTPYGKRHRDCVQAKNGTS
jgi:hypothetical protein